MFPRNRKLALSGPRRAAAWAVLLAPLLIIQCLRAGTGEPGSAVRRARAAGREPPPAGGPAPRRALHGEWAAAAAARVKVMRDEWGLNVVPVTPQNEPNFAPPAWPTCRWDPPALADFVGAALAPRLTKAGLPVQIATPEVAYLGGDAAEAKKFRPAAAAGGIICYH